MKVNDVNPKEITNNGNNDPGEKASRVGTWISVGIVGLVILGTYFILYGLYMARV